MTMISARPRLRFAPSPNGLLHRGHAYSALLNAALAEALDGDLLLRIEDIDPQRSRPALVAALEEDLAWLGLSFSPPVWRQSARMATYAAVLESLAARGLTYPCFCSRGDTERAVAQAEAAGPSWPRDPDGAPFHAGPCRSLAPGAVAERMACGEPHTIRLAMDRAAEAAGLAACVSWPRFDATGPLPDGKGDPRAWGDVVIGRRDVPTSYHLAVVVDDAAQGITHVVRGVDLEAATAVHRLLQILLGYPVPAYHHHRLLRDGDGQKFAKSRGSRSLRDERAAGLTAVALRRALGFS